MKSGEKYIDISFYFMSGTLYRAPGMAYAAAKQHQIIVSCVLYRIAHYAACPVAMFGKMQLIEIVLVQMLCEVVL